MDDELGLPDTIMCRRRSTATEYIDTLAPYATGAMRDALLT